MIPEKILDYKITGIIGEGGMATVYKADLDKSLGTKVAIKVLNKTLATDDSIRQRFRQEAKSMLNLKHPYIVNVLNYVEKGETLVIVMEYLEGETLKQMVERKGPIPPAMAVEIFKEVLEAMQYVHNKGVIHRDIKPSNIFIIEGKYPKIMDFGIVKVLGGESTINTQTKTILGSPMYMSPEQIQTPRDIDYRSDIYSLGVTLYYMLAGNPPYDITSSEFDIQTQVVREPLPVLHGIPANIEKAIKKSTRKDRNKRFQSCDDFKRGLQSSGFVGNYDDDEGTIIDEPQQPPAIPEQETDINRNKEKQIAEKQTKINDFLAVFGDYFPVTHISMMREDLMNMDTKKFDRIRLYPFKEPSKFMIITWVGGIIGLDRFQLGQTGIGVLKLLTCWMTLGIWCIADIATAMKRVREWNYKKFVELKNGQQISF